MTYVAMVCPECGAIVEGTTHPHQRTKTGPVENVPTQRLELVSKDDHDAVVEERDRLKAAGPADVVLDRVERLEARKGHLEESLTGIAEIGSQRVATAVDKALEDNPLVI